MTKNQIKEPEILEFLNMLIDTDTVYILDELADDKFDNYSTDDLFLDYILSGSILDSMNRTIAEANNWMSAQFERNEPLEYDDPINQLIIDRGLRGDISIKDMSMDGEVLIIQFGNRFDLLSHWVDKKTPERLIRNQLDINKENMIGAISAITNKTTLRKLSELLKELSEE